MTAPKNGAEELGLRRAVPLQQIKLGFHVKMLGKPLRHPISSTRSSCCRWPCAGPLPAGPGFFPAASIVV